MWVAKGKGERLSVVAKTAGQATIIKSMQQMSPANQERMVKIIAALAEPNGETAGSKG